MIEKVNPSHPDKIADRIAGAIVDLAYRMQEDPKVAVEVLIGHGDCHIIIETNCDFDLDEIKRAVRRITREDTRVNIQVVPQDKHLAENQSSVLRCGDNGIFKGMPATAEQRRISEIAREIYRNFPTDGKYILDLDKPRFIICQSNAPADALCAMYPDAEINPLGPWTGGTDVDTGAANRKLGSDIADSVTGGGLHGKDLSKADVSVNIYAWLKAQITGKPVQISCAIGDKYVDSIPYARIMEIARLYIKMVGGFEKFAEWGLF